MTRVDVLTAPVETPFPPSHVNGYLFAAPPVTIVDPGPALPGTRETWARTLDAARLKPGDVEQILLTHQHWDHIGSAQAMQRWTGARLLAPAGVRPYLADFGAAIGTEVDYYGAFMNAHGVPEQLTGEALAIFAAIPRYVEAAELDVELHDGDEIDVGGHTLVVHARPGHSHSDTVFAEHASGAALVGDHLLSAHPPIVLPLWSGRAAEGQELARSGLVEMFDSLERTAALELKLALAGHGPPILDVMSVIDSARAYYRRHDEFVLGALEREPATAWELTVRRDGAIRGESALYKLGGTLGSLELLVREGALAVEIPQAGAPRFRRA